MFLRARRWHWAAAEATEEAILNALCTAKTMAGRDGHVIHALPLDRLQDVMRRYATACSILNSIVS
jgi:D-aminopeptidase